MELTNNNIGAVVVLYNPKDDVEQNIRTYSELIDKIIIVDNSDNQDNAGYRIYEKLTKTFQNRYVYYNMGGNKGLAKALNTGIEIAYKNGCDWCLTMDSDSKFGNDIIEEFLKYIRTNSDNKIIAYAPLHIHDRMKPDISREPTEFVTWSMTSGTLLNIKKFMEIGGFDEWFFVDGLDVELGYRIKKCGYKILKVNDAKLLHQPATTVTKKLLGKELKYGIASPTRYYYQAKADTKIFLTYFAPYAFKDLFIRLGKTVLLFDNKKSYLRAWGKGVVEGIWNKE